MRNKAFCIWIFLCFLAIPILAVADQGTSGITSNQLSKLKVLADSGVATAQEMLGRLYLNGAETAGLQKDTTEAMGWFRKAAEQNYAPAQLALGMAYNEGIGIPKNAQEAVKWFRKAAEQGNAVAQYNLGGAYYNGFGVPQDYAEAAKWCLKAAEQGDSDAQKRIGIAYYKGQGVARNNVQSYMWLSFSAAQNDQQAATNLRLIEKSMTSDQIAEAKRLAKEWKPKKENAQ